MKKFLARASTGLALQTASGRLRWLRGLDHLLAVALVVWAVGEAGADRRNLFMAAGQLVGVTVAALSLALLARPRAVRSATPGPQDPANA